MAAEKKLNKRLNDYIMCSSCERIQKMYPVTHEQLVRDQKTRANLIDYLGDIYSVTGLDENYAENEKGKELSEIMNYIIRCSHRKSTD